MSKFYKMFSLVVGVQMLSFAASAEIAKTYQVTGPILEVNEKTLIVQKGDEKWEIARDEKTNMKSTPKVGDKVTINYRMTAVSIENKDVKELPSKKDPAAKKATKTK